MANTVDENLMSPYRVLDLTDEKGMFCGKILGNLGADVIKIESPGGDPSRMIGPFFHDIPDPEKSLYWFAYNTNKRSITLDIKSSEGQEDFRRLVKNADFVIESFHPGYMDSLGLGYPVLSEINPGIIVTSITPFGQSGPYRDYKISDIVAMAMSGMMYVVGDPDRPPVRISVPQAYAIAGAEATVGTLIAHYYRELTGEGQYIDMSIHESVALTVMEMPTVWEFYRVVEKRLGGIRKMATPPRVFQRYIWPCKDGHVSITPIWGGLIGAATSGGLVELMDAEGMAPDFLKEIDWMKLDMREVDQERYDRIAEYVGKFFMKHTRAELHQMAINKGVMLYPVNNIEDIMGDAQLKARESLAKVEHPDMGTSITYPRAFAKFSKTSCSLRRPPRIGEHNEEVFNELLTGEETSPQIKKPSAAGETGKKVFDGLKVVEFTWFVAGPWVGKYLADHGAEVIRVETSQRPDPLRYSAPFKDEIPGPDRTPLGCIYNNGKKSITLDLRNPRGVDVAKRLIAWADIVIENYTPGTLKKLGLDYENLKKVNPRIIMLSSSNQGQTGPYATQIGLGYHLSSFVGFHYVTGWPDRDPCLIRNAYTDIPGAYFGTVSLIAALDYRRRTGKGQHIDLSQYEAGLQCLSPAILDFDVNGRVAKRDGNRSPMAAPHGAYPCQGEDRWCAIAVSTDDEWEGFCKAIGNPAWIKDPKFATLSSRKENEEELNKLVGEWTSNLTAEKVVTIMQKAGVAAGVVQNCEDLHSDPQLKHRNHFQQLEHPVIGKHFYFTSGFRLSKTPGELKNPGPCLGEHNEYVYTKILRMSDEEFVDLLNEEVFK
ncbi:CaiB/BaiF CoA transferase family protein [Chloroflexota bacterium]